jgi:hypothetical protein
MSPARIAQPCARCGKPLRLLEHDGFTHLNCHPRWPLIKRAALVLACLGLALGIPAFLVPALDLSRPLAAADVAVDLVIIAAALAIPRSR